jgi:flagellar biosynthetic protein FliP
VPPAARLVRVLLVVVLTLVALAVTAGPAWAQDTEAEADADVTVPEVPEVSVELDGEGDATLSRTVVIILLLTVGSVAPALLLLMTSFTRFIVVLSLTKNALGLQTVPPAQVLIGLAMFLTFFAMQPVLTEINDNALQPLLDGDIEQDAAFDAASGPLREFMLAQTDQQDLELMFSLTDGPRPQSADETPLLTLVPAFVVSELRTAFIAGFVIFVPFLVIDLVVASVLMSMGMVMLPPVFISLPIKLLLFILVDGWSLIAGTLIGGVQ